MSEREITSEEWEQSWRSMTEGVTFPSIAEYEIMPDGVVVLYAEEGNVVGFTSRKALEEMLGEATARPEEGS